MPRRRGRSKNQKEYEIPLTNFESVDVLSGIDSETTCRICCAEFLDPQDLDVHIKQVHGNIELFKWCGFCQQAFPDLENLVLHIRDDHISNLKICKYCTRCFLRDSERAAHEKLHIGPNKKVYSCSNCTKTFKLIKELEIHEVNSHPSGNGVLLQSYYPFLSSILNVQVETFLKSLGTDTAYICQKCTYSNSEPERYINHLRKSNCRSYSCEKCSFIFSTITLLRKHIAKSKRCNLDAKVSDFTKKCPKCEQEVIYSVFAEHKMKCQAVKCQTCNMVFNTGMEYADHHAKTHPNTVSVLTCKYCNKHFVGEVALTKHRDRIHGPELHLYKYKCVDCDLAFKHPKILFTHFFRTHPDILPFTCKICNESFKLRQKFTIHIKLEHNSIGNVKFTEKSHVIFEEKEVLEDEKESEQENDEIVEENEDVNDKTNENEDENTANKNQGNDANANNVVDSSQVTNKAKKRKRSVAKNKQENEMEVEFLESDLSDDEPLIKTVKKIRRFQKNIKQTNKRELKCNICNKKCYTVQNYNAHIAMHKKNKLKRCIKCAESFKSEKDLKFHIASRHSKSDLTDTLKRLLENRRRAEERKEKMKDKSKVIDENMSEKFRKTIKRVNFPKCDVVAKLTEVKTGISDFIENFSPEVTSLEIKKDITINNSITIKKVSSSYMKPPTIKIYKFKPPKPPSSVVKLAMPVKCHIPPSACEHKATIKIVSNVVNEKPKLNFGLQEKFILPESQNEIYDMYSDALDNDEDDTAGIPEVAHEVMLDATDTVTAKNKYTHKIIIPNLTDTSGYEQIRIAHLLPEAPYYKIVKVKDILNGPEKEKEMPKVKIEEKIELPGGTKLVNVNPLAHLLKNINVPVDEPPPKKRIRQNKPKKEVTKNYGKAVAQALLKLENSSGRVYSGRKKSKVTENTTKIDRSFNAEITITHDLIDESKFEQIKNKDMPKERETQRGKVKKTLVRELKNIKTGLKAKNMDNNTTDEPQEVLADTQEEANTELDQTNNEDEPTEVEYLEDFDEITEEKSEKTVGKGLSLPEL